MPLIEVLQRTPFNPAGVEIGNRSSAGAIKNLRACPKTCGKRLERSSIHGAHDSANPATGTVSHGIAAEPAAWRRTNPDRFG
jgi:hypothetical protein